MTTVVSSLQAIFTADTSLFDAATGRVESKLASLGKTVGGSIENVGSSITGMGAKIGMGIAPLAAAFGLGTKVASDFDTVMAEISARTGLVGEDLARVEQYALDMGAATAFSAQQAADAFLQLLSSGQTAEEAIATLPTVLDAAAASGASLGLAADLVTDIMAAYGLGVEEAASVTNALARAAGASSADMVSLGQGFSNVGPIAKMYGLTVERTAAALAALSENGIKGAEAGTALKSMLMNMTRPTEDVRGAWEVLGTSFYDANGNARDLAEVLSDIDAALNSGKFTVEEQNELIKTLGGSYGAAALQALLSGDAISKMEAAMQSAATAEEVAAARMNTFAGATDSLKGSMETLAIRTLRPFMNNTLQPLIRTATEAVNVFADWAAEHPELVTAVGLLVTGLTMLSGIMVATGPVVAFFGAGIAALLSPIGLVALAVTGLAAAVQYAYDSNLLGFGDLVRDIGERLAAIDFSTLQSQAAARIADLKVDATTFAANLKAEVEGKVAALTISLAGLITTVQAELDAAKTDASTFADNVKTEVDAKLSGLTFDRSGLSSGIEQALNGLTISYQDLDFSQIGDMVSTHLLDVILIALPLVFGGPLGMTIGAAKLVVQAFETDFLGFRTLLEESGVLTAIQDGATWVWDTLTGFLGGSGDGESNEAGGESALSRVVSTIETTLQPLVDFLGTLGANIAPGLTSIKDGIVGFFQAFEGTETAGITGAMEEIAGVLITIVGGLIGALGPILEAGSVWIGGTLSAIGDFLPKLGEALSGIVTTISRLLEGDISGAAESFVNAITALIGGIADLAGAAIDTAVDSIATLIEGLGDLLGLDLSGAADTLRELPDFIGDVITKVGEFSFPTTWEDFKGLALSIKNQLYSIVGRVGEAIDKVGAFVFGDAWTTFKDLVGEIKDFVSPIAGFIGDVIGKLGELVVPEPLNLLSTVWGAIATALDGLATLVDHFISALGRITVPGALQTIADLVEKIWNAPGWVVDQITGGGGDGGGGGGGGSRGYGARAAGGPFRLRVGEFGPEELVMTSPLAGYVVPSAEVRRAEDERRITISGGTFILQGVHDVQKLYDQLQQVAMRRAY